MRQAERGLAELAGTVDTVIPIPNDRLLELVPKGTSFFESFRIADDVLRQAVQGISDIITTPGLINRDFSDIRSIMLGMGYAMMGTAAAKGDNAAQEAAQQAINSKLLEAGGVRGARGILINITGSSMLSLHDVNEACGLIRCAAEFEDVQINFGVVMNESLKDEVKITVIATGFQRDTLPLPNRKGETRSTVSFPVPAPEPAPVAMPEPVIEEAVVEVIEPEAVPEPVAEQPQAPDLEVPAFLRRDRKLFQ
jgi:cell division protein FtsZ